MLITEDEAAEVRSAGGGGMSGRRSASELDLSRIDPDPRPDRSDTASLQEEPLHLAPANETRESLNLNGQKMLFIYHTGF